MTYRILTLFIMLISLAVLPAIANAQPFQTSAKQAIVMDYETGSVLYRKNAEQRMPTSSMSKVLTMIVVFDALKSGALSLNDTYKVSEKAWRKGGSKMFVELNKSVKIEDLIRGVIVQSGNDATIVLAEGLAGSEDAFVTMLNEKAKSLGMDNSNFRNASGWPDPDHYSTSSDLVIMANALINDYPEYYKYYGEKEFTYNSIKQPNRNPLLYQNIGADGIKTGHTDAGGYGLIGSGINGDGRRVIMIANGMESAAARAQESKKLLNWGLTNFENKTVLSEGQKIKDLPVTLGKSKKVPAVIKDDIRMTLPRNESEDLPITISYNETLSAPIKAGDKIGTISFTPFEGQVIEQDLLAGENVEQAGIFKRVISKAKQLIKG